MPTLKKLRHQNNEICELSRVLSVLIEDNTACDTVIARELFRRFVDTVMAHLAMEERTIIGELLNHRSNDVNELGNKFIDNSIELKRFFTDYEKQWCCKQGVELSGNAKFAEDTNSLLRIILQRMGAENDEFFPVAERALA